MTSNAMRGDALGDALDIVALCGSLRARSTNRTLLEAARLLAPPDVRITAPMDGSTIPHFNPDLEGSADEPSDATSWRDRVAAADGLIVSSPEYAAGIPGSFKNALDWLVGDGRFFHKPVAILAASDRSLGAHAALRLVLATMSADIVDAACVTIPLLGRDVTASELRDSPVHASRIRGALDAFAAHIRDKASR